MFGGQVVQWLERCSDKAEVEGSIPSLPTQNYCIRNVCNFLEFMSFNITPKGLKKLKEELNHLKNVEMKEISKLIKHAASFGDLKENAAYDDAKERQGFVQGRILELEEKIARAKVVERGQTNKVQLGSTILVSLNGDKEEIEIVGIDQADPLKGKISDESPLGKALMDKSVGDKMKVDLGEEKLNCKILEIK